MKSLKSQLIIIGFLCLFLCNTYGYNPNLEYELINGGAQVVPNANQRPTFVPITRKPLIINTPPPVDPNSKSFVFDPQSKSWTMVKKTDPTPAEGTLLWNQGNDKWLTQTPHK